jgi:glycosyltransferase involved in cell wall biosynthesis
MELSVVMPCLNEAGTLASCIRKAQAAIENNGLSAEIIVADNGSNDGSVEIAESLGARVIHVAARGYGSALTSGIQQARGEYVLMGDADDSYDFGELFRFVQMLRAGNELVMGCRLPSGGGHIMPGAMPLKNRLLGNPFLSGIGRFLFHSKVTDFHCGMRAFRRDTILALDLRTTGMEFASEMVLKATLKHVRVAEVPITLHRDGRERPPHLRPWRDGWRHLRFMLLMSPRWLFLAPGLVMFSLGLLINAILIPGPRVMFGMGLDTSTMLVASMMMIVGFQTVVYALFTRAFAVTERLLEPDRLTEGALRVVTLERGVLGGLLLAAAGFALIFAATVVWKEHGFGSLNYSSSQRLVIPGVTAMILGIQTVFSSFFLSVLGLTRR